MSPLYSLSPCTRLLASKKVSITFWSTIFLQESDLKMVELDGQDIPLSPGFPVSLGYCLHSLKIMNTRYNSNFYNENYFHDLKNKK